MADLARRATRCCRYYIPPHFDTNPESLRPFVPEIWPNNVFNLSATYDLDLWPKILKIFVSHGVPIRNMYAKFHNDRLRNGWDITLWNFAKTRTNTDKHTHKHTNKQGNQRWQTSPAAPPGFIAISYGGSELRHRSILETITHRPKCQIQKL